MSSLLSRRRLVGAGAVAAVLALPAVASATPMAENADLSVASSSVNLGSYHVVGGDPLHQANVDFDIASKATWSGTIPNTTTWNDSYLRQGATIGVGRMPMLIPGGKIHVTWDVDGLIQKVIVRDDYYPWSKTVGADADCAPDLGGSAYTCEAKAQFNLLETLGIPNSPYVDMELHAKFTITPAGAVTTRSFYVGGTSDVDSDDLSLTPGLQLDMLKVPCGPVGNPVSYKLGSVSWKPAVSLTSFARIQEGALDPVIGVVKAAPVSDKVIGTSPKSSPAFVLKGSGHTTSLGALQANNVAPTIGAVGPFSGTVGQPVTLSATASSPCAIDTYTWKFSDGTTSYGPKPQRTFSKPGTYDGQLTVVDETGLSKTKNFSVVVS